MYKIWRKIPNNLLEIQTAESVDEAIPILQRIAQTEYSEANFGLQEQLLGKWVEFTDGEGRDIHDILKDRQKRAEAPFFSF